MLLELAIGVGQKLKSQVANWKTSAHDSVNVAQNKVLFLTCGAIVVSFVAFFVYEGDPDEVSDLILESSDYTIGLLLVRLRILDECRWDKHFPLPKQIKFFALIP